MTEIMDFDQWAQANAEDLDAGWQEEWNRARFRDLEEYLQNWYAVYVSTEIRRQRQRKKEVA